jgi:hypothetical protein
LHLRWRAELWQASARIATFRTLRWWRERGQPEDGEGGATGQQGQSGGGSSVGNGNDAILKALRDREAREKKALALGLPKGSSWARIAEAMHATTTTAAVTATAAAAADR